MRFYFFDSSQVLEGDRILLQIGRFSIFWAGAAWDPHWGLRFTLTDCWVALLLGRLQIVFFKRGF
jgi:hypothetical protein